MLVYVRDSDRQKVLKDVGIEEIPPHLKAWFDEENSINQKLDQDLVYVQECGSVYLVSFDIIKDWEENGFMQTPDDIYFDNKFTEND
jgi:hypothetical protein